MNRTMIIGWVPFRNLFPDSRPKVETLPQTA
jgi:hypothetical protein